MGRASSGDLRRTRLVGKTSLPRNEIVTVTAANNSTDGVNASGNANCNDKRLCRIIRANISANRISGMP